MLLGTKARLLFGVSRIMKQKTFFLYEDTLQLCNKLKSGLVDPYKVFMTDLEKPFISASSITLKERDPLLEFTTSRDAPIFAELFDINSHHTCYKMDEWPSSILIHDESLDLVEVPGLHHYTSELPPSISEPNFQTEFMDIDDPIDPDDLVDADTMFSFPGTCNLTAVHGRPSPIVMSPQHTPSSLGVGYHANSSRPPSLIQEEEEGYSFFSADTGIYDTIVRASPVPPLSHRPRQVQRMMMSRYEDIVLTENAYQKDNIVVNTRNLLRVKKPRFTRDRLVKPVVPQDLVGFFNKISIHQVDYIEHVRGTERSRKYDHKRNTSGSSSSRHTPLGGVSMRSTSDIQTPEMQNMELGQDIGIQDDQMPEDGFFDFPSEQDQHNPSEDNFHYITFDEGLTDEIEEGKEKTFEQLSWIMENSKDGIVFFQDLLHFKTRSQISKTFYCILELATDGKISTDQIAPFEKIVIFPKMNK